MEKEKMTELEYVIRQRGTGLSACKMAYIAKYKEDCTMKLCCQCDLCHKKEEVVKILSKDHKEKIVINEVEKIVLETLQKLGFKYIVKNMDGMICVFKDKPFKDIISKRWVVGIMFLGPDVEMCLYKKHDVFKFISWEDKEPYSIDELIEG